MRRIIIFVCLLFITASISLTGCKKASISEKTSAIGFQTSTEHKETLSLHRNSNFEKQTLKEESDTETTDYYLEEFDVFVGKKGSDHPKKRLIGSNQSLVIYILTDESGSYREDHENDWENQEFNGDADFVFYMYDCINSDNRAYFYDYNSGILGYDKTKKLSDNQRVELNNVIDNVFNNM